MGGLGSGRQFGGRCTDDMRALDVRKLQRDGVLIGGYAGTLRWTRNGTPDGSIGFAVHAGRVEFSYRNQSPGEPWQSVRCSVALVHTPCALGGERTWWQCPRCGRRVALLYVGGMLACRHCWGLAYRSTRETDSDRAFRRAGNLRERLGWIPGVAFGIGGKPKGMHWRTYRRMLERYGVELAAVTGYTDQALSRLNARVPRIRL